MKKYFSFLLLAVGLSIMVPTITDSNKASAQLVTPLYPTAVNDTLTDVDTAWVYINTGLGSNTSGVADNISRSVTAKVVKIDGTLAGTVRFEGSNNGTDWELIGSAYTITNTASQVKTYPMRDASGDLLFKQFRMVFLSTGTQHYIPSVFYLRRSN
jgi:hypothetical protein